MNCPRQEDISAFADAMLAPAEQARFKRHLDACPACRERLDMLVALQAGLRELPSPPLGFDLAAQFEERLRTSAMRPGPRRRAWPGWFGWGSAGVTVALSLAAGAWLGGLLIGGAAFAPSAGAARVFDPVPPGGLCAAPELCRIRKGTP